MQCNAMGALNEVEGARWDAFGALRVYVTKGSAAGKQ
jgi:hypothetical protein